MDLASAAGLLTVAVLVLANGFFVATEFAVVAVRRSRLEQLAREGHPTAAAAKDVVTHLDAYIAACQLGITMASLALGWLGEPALAHLLEPPLERLVGYYAPAAAHTVAIGAAFAVITALHIVIGELAPKGLALQRTEAVTLWVARPMQFFYLVFRWPITALNAVGNGVLRLFGLQPATGHEMVHSVEELRLLVTSSQEAGVVEESEARIASRAFHFADLTAGDLMTPRTEVEAVPVTAALDTVLAQAVASTHSRLPVYEGTLDNIVGVLNVHDLLAVVRQPPSEFSLLSMLRPVLLTPDSKPADDLLEELRAARRQLAVVLDEYGGTAGIVTIEDLIEALVGDIAQDAPLGGGQGATDMSRREPDGSLLLDGLTRLDEFEEITELRLDPAVRDAVSTVGGLVMWHLGRIPEVGDELSVAGRTLRVEACDGRRVAVVRLLPNSLDAPAASQGAASGH
jgi:CBS domain containing-hemolysin-like protein